MKVFIVTLGYAPARVFLACLEQLHSTIGLEYEHYLLNNHFPMNQAKNDVLIKTICDVNNIHYFDEGENFGLAKGYNYLFNQLNAQPEDIVIGLDPDMFPVTKNWGPALVKVLQNPKVAWASLQNHESKRELPERGYTEVYMNGVRTWVAHHPCVNSLCGWRYETLKKMGGIQEPKKFYGGVECAMFPRIYKEFKQVWAYLPDYCEERSPLVESHPLYKKYKHEYAYYNRTDLEFKEWLSLQSSP